MRRRSTALLTPTETRIRPIRNRPAGYNPAPLKRRKARNLSRAVAQLFGMDAGLVQHGQQQVGHRSLTGITDVTATLDLARCTAGQEQRQIVVRVRIAIRNAAAVQDLGMVEQAAVAVARLGELLQHVPEG